MSEWQVHLEFEEDNSSKFWRARVEGKTLYVNYGRIGAAGQTQMKELASPEAARKELEKLEREKRKKGYVDAGGAKEDEDGEDEDGEDEDGEDEDGEDEDEEGEPAPARRKGASTSRFTLGGKGRAIETSLTLDGTKLRLESEEQYDSPDKARQALERLKAALAAEGYKER
ncbi:MAG: WGR domain-containing protein [Kofleriaceae bacterium]